MSEEITNQTPPKSSSGLAIAGLVLGIIALLTSFIPIINNISAFIAVVGGILAVVALVGAVRGKHTSKGMSIAGVVLAVVSFALVLITQSAYKSALDTATDKLTSGEKPVESTQTEQTEQSSSSASSESEASAKDTKDSKESKDYSHMALGETVTLENGLAVTVSAVDHSQTKYDGSPLTCVTVSYNNTGDKSVSFNVYDWKSEDANGVQQTTTFTLDGVNELNSGRLSAGGNVTGNVYFDGEPIRVLYFSNILQTESEIGWNLA